MIVDAGYINDKGEYIEDLMYFSFEPSEQEKKKILEEDYKEEQEKEYQEYLEYERQFNEYDSVA